MRYPKDILSKCSIPVVRSAALFVFAVALLLSANVTAFALVPSFEWTDRRRRLRPQWCDYSQRIGHYYQYRNRYYPHSYN